MAKRVQEALEAEGVQLSLGETVRAFPGRTFVEEVQTSRGSYPCDLCLTADGLTPNTALLSAAGAQLAPNGGVLIGPDLATSLPGVYAVGACAVCREGSLRSGSVRVGGLEIARTGLTEAEAKRAGLRVKSVTAAGYLPQPPDHHHQAGLRGQHPPGGGGPGLGRQECVHPGQRHRGSHPGGYDCGRPGPG